MSSAVMEHPTDVEPLQCGNEMPLRRANKIRKTEEQCAILIAEFNKHPWPTPQRMKELVGETGLTHRNLSSWFTYHRLKQNKVKPVPIKNTMPPKKINGIDMKQYAILNAEFKINPIPSEERKRQLAEETGLSKYKVSGWFTYNRGKNKKGGTAPVRPQFPVERMHGTAIHHDNHPSHFVPLTVTTYSSHSISFASPIPSSCMYQPQPQPHPQLMHNTQNVHHNYNGPTAANLFASCQYQQTPHRETMYAPTPSPLPTDAHFFNNSMYSHNHNQPPNACQSFGQHQQFGCTNRMAFCCGNSVNTNGNNAESFEAVPPPSPYQPFLPSPAPTPSPLPHFTLDTPPFPMFEVDAITTESKILKSEEEVDAYMKILFEN